MVAILSERHTIVPDYELKRIAFWACEIAAQFLQSCPRPGEEFKARAESTSRTGLIREINMLAPVHYDDQVITTRRIRRGCFRSVADLRQAITDYLAHHNAYPKPFRWTASADSILEKVM